MSQNGVIKTTRIEAEKIAGPLHMGLNVIRTVATTRYSVCKMDLKYEVVVPYGQLDGDDYCILSLSSIDVSGRGSKSYGAEIKTNLCNLFYEIEVKEDEILNNSALPEKRIIIGYNDELKAFYMTLRFIEFAKENEIDLTDDWSKKYVVSNETELNKLFYDMRGSQVRNLELFVMGNKFYYLQGNTCDYYQVSGARKLSYLKHSDTSCIVDSKNRVWVEQAVFTPVEHVQATQDNFVVSEGMFYQQIPLFGTKGKNNKYIAFENLMYSQLPNVKVHLVSEVPEPVFETNLQANTGYAGSGIYSAVVIGKTKMIIAPFINNFLHDREAAEVAVVNNTIYGIVGKYDEVGFLRGHYGFNDWIVVGERPSDGDITFYESFSDVPLAYCENNKRKGQEQITMTFFDKAFESRKPLYRIGDDVRVVKEMGFGSKVKGLEGVVIGLSANKAKVEVSFFGFFKAKFELNQIEKLQKVKPIVPSRIELTSEETVEAISNAVC